MYDLSGLKRGDIDAVVKPDWRRIAGEATDGAKYLRLGGKPLVAVWGVGFGPDRDYTAAECLDLVRFLKAEGNAVLIGVPLRWREAVGEDAELLAIVEASDVVLPWSVGAWRTPEAATRIIDELAKADREWLAARGVGYLPVIWPGFNWHNLLVARGEQDKENAKSDLIPRLEGRLFWAQAVAHRRAGTRAVYVAMFDEVDEGTAIFKVTNDPPIGESPFVTFGAMPSDHYLWLTGEIGRLFSGRLEPTEEPPDRLPQADSP